MTDCKLRLLSVQCRLNRGESGLLGGVEAGMGECGLLGSSQGATLLLVKVFRC